MGDRVAVMSNGRAPAGRHAAAALRPAREPLRRGLHRHAADEPARGGRDASRTARSRSRSAASSLPLTDAALHRYPGARGAARPAASCVGVRAGDLHPASDRPDLPPLERARSSWSRRSARSRSRYFRIDAMAIRRRPAGSRRTTEARPRRRASPRPGRTSSPRSPPATALDLKLDTDVPIAVDTTACTSSTRSRVRRFVSGSLAAAVAVALVGVGRAARLAATTAPPSGAALAALSQPPVRTAIASRADLLRHAPTATRTATRRTTAAAAERRPRHDRLRPGRPRLVPRRRPEGPDRRLHRPGRGLARIKDLGFTAIWVTPPFGQQDRAGLERRLPRLLDPRLHDRRPAPRQRGRLRRVRRLRAPARAEGLPRRRRQPHRRRDHALGGAPSSPGRAPTATAAAAIFIPARYAAARPSRACKRGEHAAAADRARGATGRRKKPAWLNDATPLPQPRRHRLRLVQRALLRAGRLLRARRPVHRAAGGRERAGGRLRELDRALQGRRLPDRHGAHVDARVLRALGAEDPRRGARGRGEGLRALRRGLRQRRGRARRAYVRDRGLPNVLDFPLPGRAVRFAGGDASARGLGRAARATTTTSRRRTGSRHAADLPRQPRHGPGGAAAHPRTRRASRRGPSCCGATCSATTCSTCSAARRSCYYGDEVGMIGAGGDKAGAAGHVPDAGARVADGGAGRLAADRDRLVASTSQRIPSRPPAGAGRRCATRIPRSRSAATTVRRLARGGLLVVSRFDARPRREYLTAFNGGTRRGECDRADGDAVVDVDGVCSAPAGARERERTDGSR